MLSLQALIVAGAACSTLWLFSVLLRAIYNLYFHPLSKIPGPRSWIAFPVLKSVAQLQGQLDIKIRAFTQRYGDAVRLGPNEIVFTSGRAWKDIYGHGHAELPKYFPSAVGTKEGGVSNIINSNAADHFRFRRAMIPAFSDRALEQQESLIEEYVDLLVVKLKEVANSRVPTNMVKWYTFTTFDLIGDLAYGRSFGGLAAGKPNPWVSNIENMMKLFPILSLATINPIMSKILLFLASDKVKKSRSEHLRLTTELAMERIENKTQQDRGDFMDFLMRSRGKEHQLSDAELVSNSDTLIVAGSETTATLLCGVTYYLLKTPEALAKCISEVRSAFETEDEINFKAASKKLPYTLACLNEALRLFPPVPSVLYRQTLPNQMTPVDKYQIPENTLVGVHHMSAYHSSRNFHKAHSFCPERWLPEAQTDPESPFFKDDREAFKPFSTGPRDCIGRNLAYHEMRLILARVLWNFDLQLVASCNDWAESQRTFALWEKPPLMVEIHERKV